jgi:serine/threonine protein phosphatase PrpC
MNDCLSSTTNTNISYNRSNTSLNINENNGLLIERGNSLEKDLQIGVWESQGKRDKMEDRYKVIPFPKNKNNQLFVKDNIIMDENNNIPHYAFFAVYDGHGGTEAADFVRKNLHNNIVNNNFFKTNPEKAIQEGFIKTEKDFENLVLNNKMDGLIGSCACIALIYGNILYIASVGDSAAILCRNGNVIKLTNPHTPMNEKEKERIEKIGGRIVSCGTRLGHPIWNPQLINIGVTRAIGDIYFKHNTYTEGKLSGLIAEPEINKITLTKNDLFFLIASDGKY